MHSGRSGSDGLSLQAVAVGLWVLAMYKSSCQLSKDLGNLPKRTVLMSRSCMRPGLLSKWIPFDGWHTYRHSAVMLLEADMGGCQGAPYHSRGLRMCLAEAVHNMS